MRLVLCDDHDLLVQALATALANLGYTIEAAVTTPEDAVRAVAMHDPDVLLVDLNFPVGSGLDAAAEVVEHHPRTRVVMLTGSESPEMLSAALRLGVAGYVRKAQRVETIAEMIERAVAGRLAVDRELLGGLRDRESAARRRTPVEDLTPSERRVLQLLVAGRSTSEMVRHLGVSSSTVRTHVQSIFVKLGVHSRLQAVALLGRYGLLDATDGSCAALE